MKDILLYAHFYKNFYFKYSNLRKPVTNEPENMSFPKCEIIPKYIKNPNLLLGEYDTFIHLGLSSKTSDYIGVHSYRKYPNFLADKDENFNENHCKFYMKPTEESLTYLNSDSQKERALNILKKSDAILYSPKKNIPHNCIQQWNLFHPPEAIEILLDELSKTQFSKSLEHFYSSNELHLSWAPPFITKWENLSEFVEFYLYIINKLLDRKDFLNLFQKKPLNYANLAIDNFSKKFDNKRLLAFIGERLIPFWCYHNKLKIKYVPMIILEQGA